MSLNLHIIALLGGTILADGDRLKLGVLKDVVTLPSAGALTALGAITAGSAFTTLPVLAESGGTPNPGGATAAATSLKAVTATVAAPGAGVAVNDTFNPADGTLRVNGVKSLLTATHIQAVSAVVNAGGTGGTPGAVTITGTTGTGTPFQATGTINGSGVLTGALVVTVAGDYTVGPTSLAAEPVTGGSLSGCTVTLVMGAKTLAITTAGQYTVAPSASQTAPVNGTGAGTGVHITLSYGLGEAIVTNSGTYTGAPSFTVTPADGNGTGASIATGTLAGNDGIVVQRVASLTPLPSAYAVRVSLGFKASAFVTGKDNTGFSVNIVPPAGTTVAAGTMDVTVIG